MDTLNERRVSGTGGAQTSQRWKYQQAKLENNEIIVCCCFFFQLFSFASSTLGLQSVGQRQASESAPKHTQFDSIIRR